MVAIIWVVLNLKMSEFTDVAENKIQERIAEQVTTTKPEFSFCVYVECCSHLTTIQDPYLLW